MSPAVLAGQRLAALAASLRKDLERMAAHEQVARRLAADWTTRQADPAQRAWAATTLHAWYTGLETLLERALRQIDGEVPTGADSHRRVLEQAQLELPALRPTLLPAEAAQPLRDLLAFRHFFRNAYAVELDPRRLEENLARLLGAAPRVAAQLAAAADFFERAAETARSTGAP